MLEIKLIPEREFQRIRKSALDGHNKLSLIADMCRANALAAVKKVGSGHLGSSFSSIDIVTFLYYSGMNTVELGISHPDRDIYFSSKGHDAPAHYAVLFSLGIISREQFINLRRLGGTHGHPDVTTRGIECNTGSLGMGISKAKGMALAKRLRKSGGHIFVMTGDGELQEGQIWESLQTAAHQSLNNITAIVDCNKFQTDTQVKDIVDLGDLEQKFKNFGWHAARCDGHDISELAQVIDSFERVKDKPKVLIADTIKGKGVSFMEGPAALERGNGLYQWHSGAPNDDDFESGYAEITGLITARLEKYGLPPLNTEVIETRHKHRKRLKDTAEKVVQAYGQALVELAGVRDDIVVLDADLSADCGLRPFENAYPERFVENGIAEQDMVSMAGGLALQGYLPIVNSFGVFLASRANEQIYNNATENTKIIYVCHYAGLIPAGPGKSHQSLRDISLFGALPNCVVVQPCNSVETRQALEWCVNTATQNCMLRLVISPSPGPIPVAKDYRLTYGRGAVLHEGTDAVLFAYGPVMLHEALMAAKLLTARGVSLKVINLPWLNRVDDQWFEEAVNGFDTIHVMDDHSQVGGLGDCLLNTLMACGNLRMNRLIKIAIEDFPACGAPAEVLGYHKMSARSLVTRILETVKAKPSGLLEVAS